MSEVDVERAVGMYTEQKWFVRSKKEGFDFKNTPNIGQYLEFHEKRFKIFFAKQLVKWYEKIIGFI